MRSAELQAFIDAFREAIAARAAQGSSSADAARRIFTALETPAEMESVAPVRLDCCRYLEPALQSAEAGSPPVARLAKSLRALEPKLKWFVRGNATEVGEPFLSGHANAYVAGPGQLESRRDVVMGVSLMAPNINYPYHDHAPEEVYVALSDGGWQQNAEPWAEPGIGGLIYNPPGIRHAMRSGTKPFLAAWCLWVG